MTNLIYYISDGQLFRKGLATETREAALSYCNLIIVCRLDYRVQEDYNMWPSLGKAALF